VFAFAARFAFAVLLVQAIALGNARAQDWTGTVSVDSTAGYDDDIVPSTPGNEAASFVQISPRALLRYETPRTINNVSYDVSTFYYSGEGPEGSMVHTFSLQNISRLSPRALLQVTGRGSAGAMSQLQLANNAAENSTDLTPTNSDYVSGNFSQILRYKLDATTTLVQRSVAARFSRYLPENEFPGVGLLDVQISRGTQIGGSMGLQKDWRRTNGRVTLGVDRINLFIEGQDPTTQYDFSFTARWQRRLTSAITSTITGGFTLTKIPGQKVTNPFRPSGVAELAYFKDWGGVVAAFQHTIEPSLTTAQNTTSDEASIRTYLPVVQGSGAIPTVAFASTIGAQYGRIVNLVATGTDPTMEQPDEWTTVFADASLAWMARENLFVTARYAHTRQRGERIGELFAVQGYDRNVFSVTLSGSFSQGRPQPATLRSSANDERRSTFTSQQDND